MLELPRFQLSLDDRATYVRRKPIYLPDSDKIYDLYVRLANSVALKALVENLPVPSTGYSDPQGKGIPAFFTQIGNVSRIYLLQAFLSFPTSRLLTRDFVETCCSNDLLPSVGFESSSRRSTE